MTSTSPSRLALTLWDSIPDKKLAQAAARGQAAHAASRSRAEAQRMIADPRTKAKLHGFFHHWLELERAEGIAKDPKVFPGFDADDARRSARVAAGSSSMKSCGARSPTTASCSRPTTCCSTSASAKFYGKPRDGRRLPARELRSEAARRRDHASVSARLARLHAADRRRFIAASSSRATSSACRSRPPMKAVVVRGQQFQPEADDAREDHRADDAAAPA